MDHRLEPINEFKKVFTSIAWHAIEHFLLVKLWILCLLDMSLASRTHLDIRFWLLLGRCRPCFPDGFLEWNIHFKWIWLCAQFHHLQMLFYFISSNISLDILLLESWLGFAQNCCFKQLRKKKGDLGDIQRFGVTWGDLKLFELNWGD